MSLSEVEFFFFFPAFLLLYWGLSFAARGSARATLQNSVLVAGSLFFYATWSLKLLGLFVATSLFDYAVLRGFAANPPPADDTPADAAARASRRRRVLLALGLTQNLIALAGFKYLGFFTDSLNHALGTNLFVLRVALPLGISFYTMGRIGVLIDTYYDRIPPVRSLLVWFAFVSFFPQLIAGPIGRGSELFHQYESPRKLDPEVLLKAVRELAVGFVLKVYVAAQIGSEWVDPVFAEPGTFTRKAHVFAMVGYGAQVFGDFAGYSLIAIGVGRCLGIALPDNFNFPFLSTNPPEVWRRWHMSLNRWLFDYIYGPMVTGESFMRGRIGLGFIVVMLASGLWHGAAWTYVLWGGLHGLWLLAHYRYDLFYKSLCRKDRAWVQRRKSTPYKLVGWAVTIGFFVVTLVPFRAPSLAACGHFFQGLARGGSESLEASTGHPLVALFLVFAYHAYQLPMFTRLREALPTVPAAIRGVVLGVVVILLMMFAPVGAGTFIYAQF
ncbi:MAG: MBOAT family O-acyltransferase [Polyangiaceae bacterium]